MIPDLTVKPHWECIAGIKPGSAVYILAPPFTVAYGVAKGASTLREPPSV